MSRVIHNGESYLALRPPLSELSDVLGDGDLESQETLRFVELLSTELAKGRIDLPGFPEVVSRIHRVLADDNVSTATVGRVIGGEPVLAGQLLQLANSAVMSRGGKPVTDVPAAIMRVGLNAVRSSTMSFAVRQLRQSSATPELHEHIAALWRRSVRVGTTAYVLARRFTNINPDTALLAGLLQGVGRLYILARAGQFPALFNEKRTYAVIEQRWHLQVARSVLESWQTTDEIMRAIRISEDYDRESSGKVSLGDVLLTACILATYQSKPETLEAEVFKAKPTQRFGLTPEIWGAVLAEAREEINAFKETLG